MKEFFSFLSDNSGGIFVLIIILFSLVIIVRWLCKIFAIGKFKPTTSRRNRGLEENNSITYILTQSLVNIVDDFRHFLALLIVLLFIVLIIAGMWAGSEDENFENVMKAMQLVIASLGGLLGSIIGYYYGESAARNKSEGITTDTAEISNEGGIVEPNISNKKEVPEMDEPEQE